MTDKKRTIQLRYENYNDREEAAILTTKDGCYLCTVERTSEEGRRRFRQRARSLQQALEYCPHPIITLSPTEA